MPSPTSWQFLHISKDESTWLLGPCARVHHLQSCPVFRGTSCAAVCAHCLSWHWAPLTAAWLCPVLLALSLQVFMDIDEMSLSLLFSRWNSPSSLSFYSQEKGSSLLIIPVTPCWTPSRMSISLVLGGPGLDIAYILEVLVNKNPKILLLSKNLTF